jgi:hypothetical protein
MANSPKSSKKNGAAKPRVSSVQKAQRWQQIILGILGIILVIAMVLSLVVR